jgi:hypothetical protein
MHLALSELLHGAGVTQRTDQAWIEVMTAEGEVETVLLTPVEEGETVEWVTPRPGVADTGMSRRHLDENFWFEYDPRRNLVYL